MESQHVTLFFKETKKNCLKYFDVLFIIGIIVLGVMYYMFKNSFPEVKCNHSELDLSKNKIAVFTQVKYTTKGMLTDIFDTSYIKCVFQHQV